MIKKILSKKIWLIVIAALALGGYFGYRRLYGNTSVVRYVTAAVEKGTITVSVSGSGQVSVSNQIDMKPKVSGAVTYAGVIEGQAVDAGTLLIKLDTVDAEKSVRDAEVNLESAKLALQKLTQPADALSILQAENALAQAQESKQTATDGLDKAYDDGFNDVADTFLDLPTAMTGLQDILFGTSLSGGSVNAQANIYYYADAVKDYDNRILTYEDSANGSYQKARKAYDKNFDDYKSVNRYSDKSAIESIINETYDTTKTIAEAVKSANNFIQFYKDRLAERNLRPNSLADTHLANLNTYTGRMSAHLSTLLSIKNSIQSDKDAIVNADRNIAEKIESLNKLKNGPDPLDVQSQQLSVKQRENALLDAKETLSDYYIRAPFNGVAAKINVKNGDEASPSTVLVVFITRQKLAEISLNEVDAAKVKTGEKATLAFDAVPGLTIAGEVEEIDTIGTITQGVVTYNVKIGFNTQDERVKSGMSVSADIITDVKQDVLIVPNSAVKQQNGASYVEVMTGGAPQQRPVEAGLSNDTQTEITSGLKEGEKVVMQTITSASQSSSQQSTGIRIPGITGGGGGGPGGGGLRGGGGR